MALLKRHIKQPFITLSKPKNGAKDDPNTPSVYSDTHQFKSSDCDAFKLVLHEVSATQSSRLPLTEKQANLGRALQECICPDLGLRTALWHLSGIVPGLENQKTQKTMYQESKGRYTMLPRHRNSGSCCSLLRLPQHFTTQRTFTVSLIRVWYKALNGS